MRQFTDKRLLVATHNAGKLDEMRALLAPYGVEVVGAAEAGLPISLTKPLGVGVLNNKHKSTGEVFPQAIEVMTTLNRDASIAAVAAGVVPVAGASDGGVRPSATSGAAAAGEMQVRTACARAS